jgi:hypothetical protein
MKTVSSIFLVFCLTILACNHQSKKSKTPSVNLTQVTDVSILNLIVNPEKYKGLRVRTFGYLNLEFEGNGIYLHKEDYEHSLSKNGLWVEISRDSMRRPEIKQCIKHYVLIEGTFDEGEGHMGLFSGTIKDITRLEKWDMAMPPKPPGKNDVVKFPKPSTRQ